MIHPSAGELDCLCVLWDAAERDVSAMKLADVHRHITERRTLAGEPRPALTTVSTYLRSAVAKGLLAEVRLGADGQVDGNRAWIDRGALARTRSPLTAYRAALSPGQVFEGTLMAIAAAYPPNGRLELLVHVASVLNVPERVVDQLKGWVKREIQKARNSTSVP